MKNILPLIDKYNIAAPRYTSYPTVPEWRDQVSDSAFTAHLRNTADSGKAVALYIHIPFCESLCWYCGCNTIIKKNREHADRYLELIFREMDAIEERSEGKQNLAQIHWGGGSPSFLTNDQILKLMDKIHECFDVEEGAEIAVEIDPRTTDVDKLVLLRKIGFNRVSLGVQDFNDDVQEAINRIQSYELVRRHTEVCRELKFDSVNFDLIYGLPKQTVASFEDTLEKVVELKPDRIALYSFAYLPQSIKHMSLIKEDDLPNSEEKIQIFFKSREFFCEHGYVDIAMDHFALKDDEITVAYEEERLHRNFMGYTVQDCRDSIGVGLSSISFIDGCYIQNHKLMKDYEAAVRFEEAPVLCGKELGDDDFVRQYVINQLMCNLSVDKRKVMDDFSVDFDSYFHESLLELKPLIAEGFIRDDGTSLQVSPTGRFFLRNIACCFDAYYKKNKRSFSKTV